MYSIRKVTNDSIDRLKLFLQSVPSIKDLDEVILKNAIYVEDDSELVGAISYEKYDKKGVIRYFVFKRVLQENIIRKLFDRLKVEAQKDEILRLYCVVNNNTIEELFVNLGFKKIENKFMYIDEKPFNAMDAEDARVMEYELMLVV